MKNIQWKINYISYIKENKGWLSNTTFYSLFHVLTYKTQEYIVYIFIYVIVMEKEKMIIDRIRTLPTVL